MDETPEEPAQTDTQLVPISTTLSYGFHGWLKFFTFAATITPFIIIYEFATSFSSWRTLIGLGYKGAVAFEFIGDFILILASFYGVKLIWTLKRRVKIFYISFFLFEVAFQFVDAGVTQWVINKLVLAGTITSQTGNDISIHIGKGFFQALILALLWIPYLLRSKRVKLNFHYR